MSEDLITLGRITEESKSIVEGAAAFIIKDDETFRESGVRLRAIKDFLGQCDKLFDPQIESAHNNHKVAIDQKRKFIEQFIQSDKLYRKKRSDYELELERQAEAERKRLDDETKAKEAAQKKEMEEAAIKAEAILGDPEKAKEIREAMAAVCVPRESEALAPQKAPEESGFVSAKDYEIEVTEPLLLIQAIACGDVDVDLKKTIIWKVSGLKEYLKKSKKEEIPGCLVEKKKVTKVF